MKKSIRGRVPDGSPLADPDFFDLAGSNPELLNSGRIPDPQPAHTPLFRWLATVFTSIEARLRARGGAPLRTAIKIFWGLVAAIALFLLVGPVINKPLDFDEVIDAAEISEVDWIATDSTIDYLVTRDEEGHFRLSATEHYTANFTNGPERFVHRAFVTEFRGHHTGFELRSATVDGVPAEVLVNRGPSTTRVSLALSDGARFEGAHEIALEYELRDLAAVDTDTATGSETERWLWQILGPSWPQATKGIDVTLTLAPELDAALVRAPRATVGWLLLSGTAWLTPERHAGEGARYSFSNDDSLPPYPDLVLDVRFEAGTFAQPPTTPLFWLQSWGALIPLALLAAMLLFALAARRVVWADSAGEPWYLVRAEPPDALSPSEAAQLIERPRLGELIDVIGNPPAPANVKHAPYIRARELWFAALARAGMRAGRIGNFPTVMRYRNLWAKRDSAVEAGLRWVPDSYIRDTFIFGSLAIALLQWALLRQLSHQVVLTVVWWPGLFVLASSVLALIIVGVVWRPRPLTRKGALAMQQLKGVDVWARGTRLLDRGPVDDPLLPYATLFEPARRAGRAITAHAEREAGDRGLSRGWRGERYVALPAVIAMVVAIGVLAGTIVTAAVRPAPYGSTEFVTWPGAGLSGMIWAQTEGIEAQAEVVGDGSGGVRLEVTERNLVRFTPGGASVPQYTREWPSERLGQPLGLEVDTVRIDGEQAPFTMVAGDHTTAMHTRLPDVLEGRYEVEVTYSLATPVVNVGTRGEQQLRWAAWLRYWDDTYYTNPSSPFAGTAPVRPVRLTIEVAPEIVALLGDGGWIDSDYREDRVPHESGNTWQPWQFENRAYDDRSNGYDLRIGSAETRSDGSLVATLDAAEVESRPIDGPAADAGFTVDPEVNGWLTGHELGLTTDVGAVLNFEPGTFAGVDPGAFERDRALRALPYAGLLIFTALLTLASIGVLVFAFRMRRPSSPSLMTLSFGAIPVAGIAHLVFFWWQIGTMAGSDARGGVGLVFGGLMWVAIFAQCIVVARKAAVKVPTKNGEDRAA